MLTYQEQSAQILRGMKRKPRNGVNILQYSILILFAKYLYLYF